MRPPVWWHHFFLWADAHRSQTPWSARAEPRPSSSTISRSAARAQSDSRSRTRIRSCRRARTGGGRRQISSQTAWRRRAITARDGRT